MNKCVKCGKDYEPTWLHFGADSAEKPSGRLVVECGRDKISRTLDLCPDCTEKALEWLEENGHAVLCRGFGLIYCSPRQ